MMLQMMAQMAVAREVDCYNLNKPHGGDHFRLNHPVAAAGGRRRLLRIPAAGRRSHTCGASPAPHRQGCETVTAIDVEPVLSYPLIGSSQLTAHTLTHSHTNVTERSEVTPPTTRTREQAGRYY